MGADVGRSPIRTMRGTTSARSHYTRRKSRQTDVFEINGSTVASLGKDLHSRVAIVYGFIGKIMLRGCGSALDRNVSCSGV